MRSQLDPDALARNISTLAEDIARVSPDCADKALKIVELAKELDFIPDRQAVQDAIEERTFDDDFSDSRLHLTTSAVLSAMKRTTD